ncbi:unnamed protein product [Rotaria socialis]|uniref:VWFA domain-containing protein n=1 Tax=Rotaria socialis TaxID=392032 RepID=A0A820IKZ5_9BILA|nr:unnamed protein product [Rotaria socialis]CAF3459349.1 unnamed protein product [Rotaria socialis]CAF4311783.1 unnamed protein product [Rotaria socialis]
MDNSQTSSHDPVTHDFTLSPMETSLSDIILSATHDNEFVHISMQPLPDEIRSPCDICCVVDTSGSMSSSAEIQNDKNEHYGLSQLDLVKHALKTIINSLQDQDRLSLVSFSNTATILFKLTAMDEAGKTKALDEVEKLRIGGSTNLWDGLRTGLELLAKQQDSIRSISALFLLTDGCPTEIPEGGHLEALEKLKKKINFTCTVNTFGFGYQLDSKLLEDISILGNAGSYAFIPDGGFVGTIFVNAISMLLTTTATNVQLLIHDVHVEDSDYTHWYSTNKTEHGTLLDLGFIIYGQSKDLLIPYSHQLLNQCKFTVTYNNARNIKKTIEFHVSNNLQQANPNLIRRQKFRLQFVHSVRTALEHMRQTEKNIAEEKQRHEDALNQIEKLEKHMKSYANETDEFLKDLFTDLTGQVKEAIGKVEWFKKWGVHFLPSLTRAHLLQFCNNFKDPGVQHYGSGSLFSQIRDEMDDIFCGLPAPKRTETGATIDMSVFHNASAGCFYGECSVRLMNGSSKLVKDVQPGDRLGPHGGMVKFVVKTICKNRKAKMVIVDNNLIITAWHPIRVNQQWIMPCSLVSSPNEISCEAVYNFALDRGHTVLVNDFECVTLGHGFQEDVVRHAYYGSERVIKDLEKFNMQQNNGGIIEISDKMLQRKNKTGLVKGLQWQGILVQ